MGIVKSYVDKHNVNLDGCHAIVTGANRGIGKEIVRGLVKKGCRVTMACRSTTKANAAKKDLIENEGCPESLIAIKSLDLSDKRSIEKFVNEYLKEGHPLHILVNNAALSAPTVPEMQLTVDGNEMAWQINFQGHAWMTHRLMDLIVRSVGANRDSYGRVVNVTSKGHAHGKIPWTLIEKGSMNGYTYNAIDAYHDSKLAQCMHVYWLQNQLNMNGHDRIEAVSVHPGLIDTEIFGWNELPFILKILSHAIWPLFLMTAKTTREGAQPVLYACMDRDIKPGGYHSNCMPFQIGYGDNKLIQLVEKQSKRLMEVTLKQIQSKL